MNSASTVRLLILQSERSTDQGQLDEEAMCSPRMRDWQRLHFQSPKDRPSSDRHIISFARPNVNLTLHQRAFPVQLCATRSHLSWAPDFNTPFLKHHLRTRLGPRRTDCSPGAYLSPVGQPAHHTWYSKENRKEVKRETFVGDQCPA